MAIVERISLKEVFMKKLIVFLAAAALCAGYAYAQYQVLHNFAGDPADGEEPNGRLLFVGNGLYGVTPEGGTNNIGMIFAMNRSGSVYVPVYHFGSIADDGEEPSGGLVTDGSRLYGVTEYGGLYPPDPTSAGYGTIFRIDLSGANYWILHDFGDVAEDGRFPVGPVALRGSRLYGVTESGIGASYDGILFSVNTDGSDYQILHRFEGSPDDGDRPSGGLFLDGDTLYGVTRNGGRYIYSAGTVYSIGTDGTGFKLLHTFSGVDGALPEGALVSDGSTLYGVCPFGGEEGGIGYYGGYGGTAFSVNHDGSGFAVLHDFSKSTVDGLAPLGGPTLDGGRLYGTTVYGGSDPIGAGTIFTVGTGGSGFDVLYRCDGLIEGDGSLPAGSMLLDGGTLYGMMITGGDTGNGVVFSYDIPTPAPNPTATPFPPAEIILNGTSFSAGAPFSATFQLNESIMRSFTAYAVLILPNGAMLNALTLDTPLAPVVSNRSGLAAPFSYPLINMTIPAGAPTGDYELLAAFFDPGRPITGRGDAFLEASGTFTIH
jgi:uncharacterized repeat protein (TIGR03803 family)